MAESLTATLICPLCAKSGTLVWEPDSGTVGCISCRDCGASLTTLQLESGSVGTKDRARPSPKVGGLSHAERKAELERRIESVLDECNPKLPVYRPR